MHNFFEAKGENGGGVFGRGSELPTHQLLEGLGSTVNSPCGVRDESPAANSFW